MSSVTINDIPFDPATAECVSVHAGNLYRDLEDFWRFDEVLFKVPEGYWFVLRPLAPDEARKWLRANRDDILLRQVFPDEAVELITD